MVLMGLATALIGALPGYGVIGNWAPIGLVVLRLLQGVAVGGQWGGAALMALESAPPGRRGFYGSFVQVGVPLGVVLANLVFLVANMVLGAARFAAWGWRLAFLLSIVLVVVAIIIHRHVEELRTILAIARRG
jgi:MFS family permease